MIDANVKIHNKFSFELKLGFITRKKIKQNEFVVNSWFFLPNSLDINPYTYHKEDFYRDLKSNIRLITPVYLLRDIVSGKNSPEKYLEEALTRVASNPTRTNINQYEYHLKMFASIFKSAVRDETSHLLSNKFKEDNEFLVETYVDNIKNILKTYRNLRRIINVPTINPQLLNYFFFADVFMSNVIEQHAFKILNHLNRGNDKKTSAIKQKLVALIKDERGYKKEKGFPVTERQKASKNRELVHQFNLLKKYAENVLFLATRRKKDGILKEQIYLSLAAGISMIFATAVAFSFQRTYGNLTMPFFVALVVSYMLKDRIKELGRYYFAHKLGRRYFDHITTITLNDSKIGWSKEAVDFISELKTPPEVMRIRNRSAVLEADNRNNDEKILLYRKRIRLNRNNLDKSGVYTLVGVNDIIRFNISNLTNKMDNPVVPMFFLDEHDKAEVIKGEKIYYLNLIIQFRFQEQLEYKRFRIVMNREGIKAIEKFDNTKT